MDAHELPVWTRLVALMLVGDGRQASLTGLARTVDEDGVESRVRIWVDGPCVRRESEDGRVLWIQDRSAVWSFDLDHPGVPEIFDEDSMVAFVHDDDILLRSAAGLVEGEDDRRGRLERDPQPTTFLGRDAWTVDLQLGYWKSGRVTWVVDAATGLVLSEQDAGGTVRAEWLELEVGVAVPEGAFGWDGPVRRPEQDDERDEWCRVAEESSFLGLPVPVPVADVMVHDDRRDGRWRASLELSFGHVTLMRAPSGRPPRYEGSGIHQHRWSDERWDWLVVTPTALDDPSLAEVRRRLEAWVGG